MDTVVLDCLATGDRLRRVSTLDAIGTGPRLVLGILRSEGYSTTLIPCSEAKRKASVIRRARYVLVSGMSTDLGSMERVRRFWVGKPAIAGGPSSVDYGHLLRRGYDYVVIGEAELPLPLLMERLDEGSDVSSVPNVAWLGERGPIRNPGPPYVTEPHLWRFTPDVEAVRAYPGWWGARVYVEVVRGCSNFYRPTLPLADGRRCIFCDICRSGPLERRSFCPIKIPPGCGYCSVPALFGPARSRPLRAIVDEVHELLDIGVRRVVLSAPDILDYGRDWLVKPEPLTDPRSPPPNLDALEALLSSVTDHPKVGEGEAYVLVENIKPNLVNEDVAKLLGKYLRGTPVHIGLETGDEEHHRALGRPSTVGEVIRAVRLLREAGLNPYVYVIHGLPGESERTVENTVRVVERVREAGAEHVTLYRFTPLKGTAFEGFPRPPPAVKSVARPLYEVIRKINREANSRYVGKVVKVVGVSSKDNFIVSYMLPHGPVVRVKGDKLEGLVGSEFYVRITGVIKERVLEGVFVNEGEIA